MLFGRAEPDHGRDAGWATFWANQRGPKWHLKLSGAAHDTFLDFAVLLRTRRHPSSASPPEEVAKAAGTIDGRRATEVVRTYVNAYFDQHLRHRHTRLLYGLSAPYPEVTFPAPHP
ncbi:hypothetical protein AB0I98_35555 [Streptomyces sp. NPDC050211]|uniref:hypothetical protein n=1 Tax=Streptomyces sp. NPDC050211 TaxID=3154932 RepID=UPI003445FAD6